MLHDPASFFRLMLLLPPTLLGGIWLLFPETGFGEFSAIALQIGIISYLVWAIFTVLLSFKRPWPSFRLWLSWAPFSYWLFTFPVFIFMSNSSGSAVMAWTFGAMFAIPLAYGMLGITAFIWYMFNPHNPDGQQTEC